jgi:hypothetical protein
MRKLDKQGNFIAFKLTFVFLFVTVFAYAQVPVEPTSATDSNVRIERHRKGNHLHHDKRGNKLPGESRVFQNQNHATRKDSGMRNRSVQRQNHFTPQESTTPGHTSKRQKRFTKKESQSVFKRQSHFAQKDNNRSRHRSASRH